MNNTIDASVELTPTNANTKNYGYSLTLKFQKYCLTFWTKHQ